MAKATSTTPDADLFEDVVADYVGIDDLDGRHLVVIPDRIETAESTSQPGKTYERIIGDVIVLDGPVTDKITEVPFVVTEMYLSATNVVNRLKSSVKDRKPRLGLVDSVPSKRNKNVKAYGFQPVDATNREVRDKANAAIVAYREAAHAEDPFAA
jgi:hypothetical protein